MNNCDFCLEFEQGNLQFAGENLGNRILFETNNFIVFPGLGQLVEGYLIIASKEHYISIGETPTKLYPELLTLQEKTKKILEENYTDPIFFEHGIVSPTKRAGCCVDHAHLHAIPVNINILSELMEFSVDEIYGFHELKQQFEKGNPYLFYEDNLGHKYLFDVSDSIPSQYIRKIISKKIGKPEIWNWAVYPGLKKLKRTLVKLEEKFSSR